VFKAAINEEIKVPAHIDYLGDLRNFVTKAGRKHSFPPSVVNAFKLCIDEAATNIIKHAYRDLEGMITMRVIIKKNSMTVVLIDQGKYFDPRRVSDPDLKRYVDIGKKGGLGIFIMRKLLDEIDYHHTEEGNELRLTKLRDSTFRKKKVISAPSLSGSLKSRYLLITAAVLVFGILSVYFFNFFRHASNVLDEFVINEKPVVESIARLVWDEEDTDFNYLTIGAKVSDFIKGRKEIHKIIVTNLTNFVEYSSDEELFFKEYKMPSNREQPRPNLFSFKNNENEAIYSFVKDINSSEIGREKVGILYVQVKKETVSSEIAKRRVKDLQVSFFVLLVGLAGTTILVYFVLNPFRKLATWVKDLGSGEVKDEIDFDGGDEVGEIAQAFSEITDKFRKSQKNLAEQERIQKEMQLAQDIQQTLLPSEVPDIEGYQIASYYEAAKHVGGDYYDFVQVDKDTLGIVVADVSGKGVPGSLVMTMIRTALRTEARSMKSASEVLARVNDFVVGDMKKGMFVTLFYVIIDSKKRRINYASAGHNPMILYRQSTKKTYYLNPRGFPVGISLPDPELFKKSIESDTIQLAEDDILLIYTDGITEAMNNSRELFSEERLLDVVRKSGNLKTEEFVEKLKDEIHSFTEGFEQNDDITLVAIKEKSTPEKIELNRAQTAHRVIMKGKSIRDACEEAGITTYAYYNKYKKIFEEEGLEGYSIDDTISVEAKHLSIEEKTKIYDIIKKHPEYGAKRISEELNSETYGYTEINESRIYDELVRSRLNTRQLREAYIARSGRKKRMKAPGTPMLTLDGQIILDQRFQDIDPMDVAPVKSKEKPAVSAKEEKPAAKQKKEDVRLAQEPDDNFYLESLMTMPLEDLLKKQREPDLEEELTEDEDLLKVAFDEKETRRDAVELDEPEPETVIEDVESGDSEMPDDNISAVQVVDDIELQKPYEEIEEIEIEHEFSFKDIWEDQSDDTVLETEDDESGVDSEIYQDEIEQNIGHESENETVDIDEILNESEEPDEIGFEMLAKDTSFKDEITFAEGSDNGEFNFEEGSFVADSDHELNELDDKESDVSGSNDSDQIPDQKEDHEDVYDIHDDELLAEEKSEEEFSFSDLLNEIESDISFFDRQEFIKESSMISFDEQHDDKVESADSASSDEFASPTSALQEKDLALGLKYYREKNYNQAVEHFAQIIKKYPNFKEALSILGNAYYRNNQIDLAIRSYQRVKQLDPFDVDAYENIGVIYANMGNLDDAIKEWKTLLEIKPDREDISIKIKKAKELLTKF
jgi:serine phosphatase RsbU (regulator of sigma subunit)/anti-sigma regulatory factor (Ser/Thr protein kinase)/TolA-binding protein